jgi:hypothetical protein
MELSLSSEKFQVQAESPYAQQSLLDNDSGSSSLHLINENFKLTRKMNFLEQELIKAKSQTNMSFNDTSTSFDLPSEFKLKW